MKHVRQYGMSVILLMLSTLALAACGSSDHKKHYSQVYSSQDGYVYARSYDDTNDTLLWYILYLNSQPAPSRTLSSLGSSSSSGTSWRTSPAPASSGLDKTDKVVETDKDDEPTDQMADASDVSPDEITDADTTEAEAQADANAEDSASDDSSSDGGDSGDSGSSDGGGSFDSGGGDAGGDAGGF